MKEVWKDIKGFEGLYNVSNLGRVKSLKCREHKILIPVTLSNGYYIVTLYIHGKRYIKLIHRLVSEAFVLNPDNLPCVNHINGIKTDNRAENLEWCTYKSNNIHAMKTGLNSINLTPVLCVELNLNFESLSDACMYIKNIYPKCRPQTIRNSIINNRKLYNKYTFKYL